MGIAPFLKHRVLVLAALLALVGSVAAIPTTATQKAQAADFPGWYMLVSDYYDGTAGHGDGVMRCLSTNGETSTSGGGTHQVYLAKCNPSAPGQFWRILNSGIDGQYRNGLTFGDGINWCLSRNYTKPAGGFDGSGGAYTSHCSTGVEGQLWAGVYYSENTWALRSPSIPDAVDNYRELSTTSSSPYPSNLYQVFNVDASYAETHRWRLYHPAGSVL